MKYKYSDDELKLAIQNSYSISNVCKLLKIKQCGGNYKTLKTKINNLKIDTSHFTGQSWNFGDKFINNNKKIALEFILIEKSTYNRWHLKRRLVEENILEYKCVECNNIGEWNGKKLSLHLDHENGVNDDNRLENLRFLCPNCHSQTLTYCGKNNKKHR